MSRDDGDGIQFIDPIDLTKSLDRLVVGQRRAKIQLSILFSMHLAWFERQDTLRRAPNGIFLGPTGVGKTFTLRNACSELGLPFVVIDSTSLVPQGIVGMQVEDILEELVDAARTINAQRATQSRDVDRNGPEGWSSILEARSGTRAAIDLASRGVVFLDEFDKLAKSKDSSLNERAQRRLLKLTDGGSLSVGTDTRNKRELVDTTGILFIAGGAFEGIRDSKIRSARPAAINRFLASSSEIVSADLANYGFLPELIGRFPLLVEFEALDENDLLNIIRHEAVSPLAVWRDYASRLGLEFTLDDEAAKLVASRAKAIGLGARGLQQIIFPHLAREFYRCLTTQSTQVHITLEGLNKKATEGGNGI